MSLRLVTGAFLAALGSPPDAAAKSLAAGLQTCREIPSDTARLACYDRLAVPDPGEVFIGRGNGITPAFEVAAPRLMRFESADVIMVIYLLDAADRVVQNLHLGGAGGGEYLIKTPGRYHVQVNATGGWRIDLAPPVP
ncbi:hypothetical protein ACTTAK_07190 [Rhodobacter capsulatus]|uniref:hypothetical protein n=1 Tax=Rhodobacter capsulatus TaxID=1061 RepID=UPI001141EDF6|nr:hypothetical protein [Rhodobacter capsulatus]TQD37353.1 hypothetical protein FKW81_01820 [Rhodobacter capsulatus]